MSRITRRAIFRSLPAAGSAAALVGPSQAAPQIPGKLKITKLVYHKCSLRWRDLLFVEVHTDGGVVGLGEGTCHGRVDVVEAALRWLEPYLIGADPTGIEGHVDRINYRLSRWNSGIIPKTALSAVEIALWDIEGKRLGVPVWRLLGGPTQTRMRAYYTHWNAGLQSNAPQAYADLAVETVQKGWTAVKFGVARGGTETDRIRNVTAILEAIRKAVGSKLDIGLEFAESLTMRTATRMARALEPYYPLFMEEPLPREKLA